VLAALKTVIILPTVLDCTSYTSQSIHLPAVQQLHFFWMYLTTGRFTASTRI